MVPLFTGILTGNFTEPVVSKDDVEIHVISKLLEFDSSSWYVLYLEGGKILMKRSEKKPEDDIPGIVQEEPWQAMGVRAHLGRFGFQLSRAGDHKSLVDPLVKFEMNEINAALSLETDGKMKTNITLKSIILEDTREFSPNIHRRLIAPTTKSDTENQLDLTYTVLANRDMEIVVNMFAPRFVLLPDIYTELFVYSMNITSEFEKALKEFTEVTAIGAAGQEQLVTSSSSNIPATNINNFAPHLDVKINLRSPEIVAMEDTKKRGKFFFLVIHVL